MRVLITGFTGTLGTAVRNYLLKNTQIEIIGISRDEQKQNVIPAHPRLKMIIGDITNYETLSRIPKFDAVGHFAALKCVDILEKNPSEAFRVNTQGTFNIVRLARENEARVVLASTDKAFEPINAYGMSKAMAEKIVLAEDKGVVCRYGNVIGSRGSVINKFVQTLLFERTIYITDSLMTRFWMSIDDAAEFVISGMRGYRSAGLHIPRIKSAPIVTIGQAVAHIMNIDRYAIEDIGIRPGEKVHETLDVDMCSEDPQMQMNFDELVDLLKPQVEKILDQCEKF